MSIPATVAPLWAAPAWRHAARSALESQRPLLESLQALPQADRPWGTVRFGELLSAAGMAQLAWSVLDAEDGRVLPEAVRGRWAFARDRLLGRLPGIDVTPTPSTDDTPLGRQRAAVLRAEQATLAGAHDEALAAWQAVLAEPVESSLATDELVYEAGLGACRLALPRGADAIGPGERAVAVARKWSARGDEAVAIGALYPAVAASGDTDRLLALGARAGVLPTGLPGALPPGYVSRLRAARAVADGRAGEAIRALDEGLQDAYGRRDSVAYAGLILAKATVFRGLGDDWLEYRTLRLGLHTLKGLDADAPAALLQPWVRRFREAIGEATWARHGERLVAELGR